MSCDYALLINGIINNTNKSENGINTDDIDILLTTMTDVYISILENGLSSEVDKIQFKYNTTKDFFLKCYSFLKLGKTPQTMKFMLDFLLINTINEKKINIHELFELFLLSKIMPLLYPESDCIVKYMEYIIELCSYKMQHFQLIKFEKYIDKYNIPEYFKFK